MRGALASLLRWGWPALVLAAVFSGVAFTVGVRQRLALLDRAVASMAQFESRAVAPTAGEETLAECLNRTFIPSDDVVDQDLELLQGLAWSSPDAEQPRWLESAFVTLERPMLECSRHKPPSLRSDASVIGAEIDDQVPDALSRALALAVLDIRSLRRAGEISRSVDVCVDSLRLQREFEAITGGALGHGYPETPHWMLVVECLQSVRALNPTNHAEAVARVREVERERGDLRAQLERYRTREELRYLGRWLSASQREALSAPVRASTRDSQRSVSLWGALVAWWRLPRFERDLDRIIARASNEPFPEFELPSLGSQWLAPTQPARSYRKQTCLSRAVTELPHDDPAECLVAFGEVP